jgi:hypothetical protein
VGGSLQDRPLPLNIFSLDIASIDVEVEIRKYYQLVVSDLKCGPALSQNETKSNLALQKLPRL